MRFMVTNMLDMLERIADSLGESEEAGRMAYIYAEKLVDDTVNFPEGIPEMVRSFMRNRIIEELQNLTFKIIHEE